MKNPRFVSNSPEINAQARGSFNEYVSLDRQAPARALPVLEKKEDDLSKALRFFKFSDAEIDRVTTLVAAVAKIAATANWVIGAITTVKTVLTAIGLFDKEDDASKKLLEDIASKVERIYKHLLNDSRRQLYVQKTGWRTTVSAVRNSLADAAKSRSQENINALIDDSRKLQAAIEEMLALDMALITFDRVSQEYVATYPRSHWLDAASPFYMEMNYGPLPADYSSGSSDLGETIWDPGYYLDILFDAIGVRIAALTALEPGFRSTGQNRQNLVTIYEGLLAFIKKWIQSLFMTRVVGPIDPLELPHPTVGPFGLQGDPVSGHYLSHPFQWPTQTIALGVVDPATGLAALDFQYGEKFAIAEVQDFPNSLPYWVLTNFSEATTAAYARREQFRSEIWARCGIDRAYALYHHLGDLIFGPNGGSEFVDLTDPAFGSGDLRVVSPPEQVDLGIIGTFAGKPGKKYKADRYHWYTVKKFRIPMARRMDVSGIQLGYRLEIDVGGPDSRHNIVLCPYSAQTSTTQENQLPLFPSGTMQAAIGTDTGTIYDVLQSATFSANEEEEFEREGKVAGKRRLFLNPRSGRVDINVEITFSFDINNPEHAFIGYADVEIGAPDNWPRSYGFFCDVTVYEERWLYLQPMDQPAGDVRKEVVADQMRLHFCPSFLVVEPDYFTDRDAGIAAMNKMFSELNNRFAKSKQFLGPLDPIERIKRPGIEQQAAVDAFAEFLREAPQEAESALRRYASPIAQR